MDRGASLIAAKNSGGHYVLAATHAAGIVPFRRGVRVAPGAQRIVVRVSHFLSHASCASGSLMPSPSVEPVRAPRPAVVTHALAALSSYPSSQCD